MAEPGNKNPAVDPAEGGSQEVGERMGSLETQLSQLTLVSSLVENQRELVSSLVEQQGEKVESSGFVAAAPGGGGPETSIDLSADATDGTAGACEVTTARENEVREGRTRAQTRAVYQQSVSGLVATLGPISASEIMYALLAEQRASDAVELPQELVQDVESEPGSYQEAR